MGSLYAGPRTGMFAYTEKDIRAGDTFYIAIRWGKPMDSGIVEVRGSSCGRLLICGTGNDIRVWLRSIKEFLRVANNYIDLYGNPNPMIQGPRRWWQFWKKPKQGYPECPPAPPCPIPPMVDKNRQRIERYKKEAMFR